MKQSAFKIRLPQTLNPVLGLALMLLLSLASGFRAEAQNWLLNGNAGTNPAINFLGTTDAQGLQFRTNGIARMTITSGGNVGVGIAGALYRFHVATSTDTRAGFFDNTFNSTAETYGIYANANNPGTGNSTGGLFSATGAGGTLNRGIRATASGNVTNHGVSAFAQSAAGQTAIGLVAQASGAGTNLAAQFHGNTHINNGNLGIGISTPTSRLHVIGDENTGTASAVRIVSGTQNLLLDGNEIDALSDGLYLNNNSNQNILLGNGGGRVGVGTNAPESRLHVKGDLTLESAGNTKTFSIRTNPNGDIQFVTQVSPVPPLPPMPITRMVISDQLGYVGIGTSSPSSKLHVRGDLRLENPSTDREFVVRTADNGDLQFNSLSGTEQSTRMVITDANGLVGIGTSSPPLGYRLAVNGRVICEEVRVQLSEDWPDYVFSPEYCLMPLDELEKSITAEKHLPGIPSAAEVKGGGIAVGEMQALLLEKVEELTLYLLQMKKENEALRQAVESLKK